MSSSPTFPKDSLLFQIWSICTTLTEEAMVSAATKAKEMGFDADRGLVSLSESFINLSSGRAILEDAIEKQKLVQLPITVQKVLLNNLEAISKSLQGLSSGVDEIVNLTTAIEALNTAIWTYGLHNLSDQVLGYQKKLNQIKNQELQISKAIDELVSAQQTAEKAAAAASETEQKRTEAVALLDQIKQNASNSASFLDQIKDAHTQVTTLQASVQQNEKQSGELTSNIKTSNNELVSLDGSIRKFYGEVEEYRRKIAQTGEDATKLITTSETTFKRVVEEANTNVASAIQAGQASTKATVDDLVTKVTAKTAELTEACSSLLANAQSELTAYKSSADTKLASALEEAGTTTKTFIASADAKLSTLQEQLGERSDETIGENKEKTEMLVNELSKLKDQIREQIQQATGFTLFGAFQARQNQIAKSKNIWVWAIGLLVLISAGVTIWIAHEAQLYSVNSFVFWVKLSLTIPLGFAITFCTVQYSKERRLEEEYAFKSSISVSLNPYRDLVHSILEKDGQVDQSKYTDFVIGSVANVFTSPTEKVFDSEIKPGLTKKTFKEAAEIIGTAVKAAK